MQFHPEKSQKIGKNLISKLINSALLCLRREEEVVNIKDGFVVQSFGFNKYLPLGKPECLIENLDRWGADEILLNIMDLSSKSLGPDLRLLEK